MAKFRRYSPYNNMLVRTQNPACSFYATQTDWEHRFKRALKEDARPMLILAPMHPVMLVYELDQTIGDKLPDLLAEFARTDGLVPPGSLGRLIENAATYGIEVAFRSQSSTLAGFATCYRGGADWKMRVVVHDALESQAGSACCVMSWRIFCWAIWAAMLTAGGHRGEPRPRYGGDRGRGGRSHRHTAIGADGTVGGVSGAA